MRYSRAFFGDRYSIKTTFFIGSNQSAVFAQIEIFALEALGAIRECAT
jgi:hypothetical protein